MGRSKVEDFRAIFVILNKEIAMKKSKFNEQQVVFAHHQAETGRLVNYSNVLQKSIEGGASGL
jgi:hypothetical protein